MKRAILIILDSVGIGAAPDAADYGDAGANTLLHTAEAVGGLHLNCLQNMGLGNIPALITPGLSIPGVPPADNPFASYGAMREVSRGKDTTTGHWEIAGLELTEGFRVFPGDNPSFPAELIHAFETETGRKIIGNKAASGTAIIEELGPRQMETGSWIVYTSADSVFQIAAHEDIIPLEELYHGCEIARRLCNQYRIGRVIARPYKGRPACNATQPAVATRQRCGRVRSIAGRPGGFQRTGNRRDYSFPLPEPTVLDRLTAAGVRVMAVGKIEDIFAGRGITQSFHTVNNAASQAKVTDLVRQNIPGLIFANLIDFDMLYGHRRDAVGYAHALEQTDAFLAAMIGNLGGNDLLILTADHGNDPAFHGTDHTREYVPLLVYKPGEKGRLLGIRHGFYDVAQSLAGYFKIPPLGRGRSFLPDLRSHGLLRRSRLPG